MSSRSSLAVALFAGSAFIVGCAQTSQPTSPSSSPAASAGVISASGVAPAALKGGSQPGYEEAYVNGATVTINAIEVPQNQGPLEHAAADFYLTVYPPDKSLWPDTPQCNPCDHDGQGIDFIDFHNHVLDSMPSQPGHGEYNPLWHVFAVLPADFSRAGQIAYAARLPMKSEADVDAAIAAGVAVEQDLHFYFICAVVDSHAAH
jgi:hypothetical protein